MTMDIQEEKNKRKKRPLDTIKHFLFLLKLNLMFLYQLVILLFSIRIKSFIIHLGFWGLSLMLIPFSSAIIYVIACITMNPQYAFVNGTSDLAIIKFGELLSSSDNARYILSSMSQIQASIFGIFFTLSFLIFQIQIQNRSASPNSMRQMLKSKRLLLIALIFILSIMLNIVLINMLDVFQVNIFWALTIFLFSILMLLMYVVFTLLDLSQKEIREEIQNGEGRANLQGANLERIDLEGSDLSDRNLSNANLIDSNLQKVSFSKANLSGADLSWSNLKEASLSSANLKNSKLVGANLTGTALDETDLNNADLTCVYCGKDESKWPGSWFFYYVGYVIFAKIFIRRDRLTLIQYILKEYNKFYDEAIIIELLKAKNLGKSKLDDMLRNLLIEKAKELEAKTDTDAKLRGSIELFLSSQEDESADQL